MKTFLTTTVAILLFTITCRAQWTLTGGNLYPTLTSNNLAVGTISPEAGFKLDVNGLGAVGTQGSARIYLGTTDATHAMIQSRNTTANQNLIFYASSYNFTTGNIGVGIATPNAPLSFGAAPTADPTAGTAGGTLIAINDNVGNAYGIGLSALRNSRYDIWQQTGVVNGGGYRWYIGTSEKMTMDYTGNVGIGTITPNAKLTVNGTIHSKSVVVDNSIFPDYVFNKTYALRPLSAVKTYIDLNHHLPEMPSAAEVAKNGQNLGEINTLLLKKVEELTLYMIEKDKQMNQLQEQVKKLLKTKKQAR